MKTIKLLGISASPRKLGNSRFLLNRALAAAEKIAPDGIEKEIYSFAGKKFGPCLSCFRCIEKGDCIVEDDFQALRDKWLWADAIIYSVPIYHMGLPGQLKCFFDRLGNSIFVRFGGTQKLLKITGNLVQGAHLFAGQEQVLSALINHALLMSSIPVAGDPWQCYIGAGGWTRNSMDKDGIAKLFEAGEEDAETAVEAVESVGKRVVQMAAIVKGGGEACRDMLTGDGVYSGFLSHLDA